MEDTSRRVWLFGSRSPCFSPLHVRRRRLPRDVRRPWTGTTFLCICSIAVGVRDRQKHFRLICLDPDSSVMANRRRRGGEGRKGRLKPIFFCWPATNVDVLGRPACPKSLLSGAAVCCIARGWRRGSGQGLPCSKKRRCEIRPKQQRE